jgi:hypothetical protein
MLMPACVLTLFLHPDLSAQTSIKGRVTDSETFEPVVFANVVFKGAPIGVRTDFDGNFTLASDAGFDSVVISFIGYETQRVGVIAGTSQIVDIQLRPALYSLSEVKITPGENPAHILLRQVWANRDRNSMEKLSSWHYENYSRSTVYLRKFGSRSDDRRHFRPFEKEFDEYSVGTGEENIPALPSYITESISDNYYLKSPERKFTHLRAVHSEGIAFETTDMVAQLVTRQENFYFPDNTVTILDRSFISPLSRFGLLYYRYYIVDTIIIDNRYHCYEVRVVPKRETDPVFRGSFWINDTTFALKRISVEIPGEAEINFIRRARIQQDYEPAGEGAWFPVRTRFMADAVNIFVTNFSRKSNIVVNQPFEPDFYGSELKISPLSRDYGSGFWTENRTSSLDHLDSLAAGKMDSLKLNNKVRISAKLVEASIRGYYNFGWFEAGPWIMLFNRNEVEGSRFRAGGRTNINFSRNLILDGYIAWGTKDRSLKGSIQSEIFLSKEHWSKLGLQYRNDVERTGSVDEFFSGSSFLTFATSFGGSENMNRSELLRGWIESDLFRGMTGKLVFTRRSFSPAGDDPSIVWYDDRLRTYTSSTFLTSELGMILNYQPKAVYVVDGVRRFPVNFNKYPVFRFEFFKGFDDLFHSDYAYRKIIAGISQNFNMGGLGSLEYDLGFTKVYGSLPYPLLITLAGNESVFRTSRTYNLMNYGEFVADEALELYCSYHMNGLILSRIPILKKLQWRTVFSARAAFGSFDDQKNGFYDPLTNPEGILSLQPGAVDPFVFKTLSRTNPYAELSYGIENIFRVLRIDLVHRLTHTDNPGTSGLAVKVSGVFRF